MDYAKITLVSNQGQDSELSVDIFLPEGLQTEDDHYNNNNNNNKDNNNNSGGGDLKPIYYSASRFEHGSMIGNIRYKGHVLFGESLWRMPHNSNWPESGVGLASEFGVGDEGDLCVYRCGWPLTGDITNGLLGYRQARIGDSFLKIGVGELIKGSCPACDSAEDYKFNSPYLFARPPVWSLTREYVRDNDNDGSNHERQIIHLHHQASLRSSGYRLTKSISLRDKTLEVTTSLTNTGTHAFSTVWYSHNFFHCDGVAVGPGYRINLNLTGQAQPLYEEPGTWSWSTPLQRFARIVIANAFGFGNNNNGGGGGGESSSSPENAVWVEMKRALDPGIRIKTEFTKDDATRGGYVMEACDTRVTSTLEGAAAASNDLEMYAYNLYLERGTFSPEPQILLHLQPQETQSWTQRLDIASLSSSTSDSTTSDTVEPPVAFFWNWMTNQLVNPSSLSSSSSSSSGNNVAAASSMMMMTMGGAAVVAFLVVTVVHRWYVLTNKRSQYTRISSHDDNDDDDNYDNDTRQRV